MKVAGLGKMRNWCRGVNLTSKTVESSLIAYGKAKSMNQRSQLERAQIEILEAAESLRLSLSQEAYRWKQVLSEEETRPPDRAAWWRREYHDLMKEFESGLKFGRRGVNGTCHRPVASGW